MTHSPGIPPHIQKAIAAIAELAPDLAGRIAAFACTRTKRRPLRAGEKPLLSRAEALEIRHGRQRIAAWSWGAGPTVHLVHGWNARATELGPLVEPLVAAGMRVVAHDSVGHGASTGASSHVIDMAETLVRVVEATGPARAIIGHSLGGTATAIALARGLPVARATLMGSPADTSRWPEDMFGLRGEAADLARAHAEERLRSTYSSLGMSRLGASIRVPVLVVHDRADDVVDFDEALATVRSIRDAGLIATHGLGHSRILRDAATIEEVVRFTASDVPRQVRPAEQERIEQELFRPELRQPVWQLA